MNLLGSGSRDYLAGLTAGEVAWLRGFLIEALDRVPDPDRYQPYIQGGHFAEEECQDALHEEAAADGDAIREAALAFSRRGRWPRLRAATRFFLAARLTAAWEYCLHWLEANRSPANTPALSLTPQALSQCVIALVSDYWDDTACTHWVRDNASLYIARPFDFYSEDEQRRMDEM